VGPAPGTKQGILFNNPNLKTKLVKISRSYQKLDSSDPIISHIPIVVSYPFEESSTSLVA